MKKPALLLFVFIFLNAYSQKHLKSFNFKKGEVFDLILLTGAPKFKEGFKKYKETAFPVAFEFGYQPQPGFKTTQLTLGNYLPTSLLIGKWKSKKKRESFLKTIVKRVPDFHQQRRNIFTYFGLSYHALSKDLKFTVNSKKYNVATAFWKRTHKSYAQFLKQWKKEIIKFGGKFILELPKGISPTGYNYNPDFFSIIQWENKDSFEAFSKKHSLISYEVLKNVHQFVID